MANDEKLYTPYLALFKVYYVYCEGVWLILLYMQNRLEEELKQSREDNDQLITSHCETQVCNEWL